MLSASQRKGLLGSAHTVVVKIGSTVLTSDEEEGINEVVVRDLVRQVCRLLSSGRRVIMVSSGAISAGLKLMGISLKGRDMPLKQAAAAVGQSHLVRAYERFFQKRGYRVGQILLTHEDVGDRPRFLNACHTLDALLARGIVPIVNENDTVAVEEIRFGDNDTLAAQVASMVGADLLLILSDVDGFYTADPSKRADAGLIPLVEWVTAEFEAMAGVSGSRLGTGGMVTKLGAAKMLGELGIPTLVVRGRDRDVVLRALSGEEVGTLFLAKAKRLPHRKHWIAYSLKPRGWLRVDEGARSALSSGGKSLLPSGVIDSGGKYEFGDSVRCLDEKGQEFARGLVNYGAGEVARIKGRHSRDIERILGYRLYDEVIHRDNLVLL